MAYEEMLYLSQDHILKIEIQKVGVETKVV